MFQPLPRFAATVLLGTAVATAAVHAPRPAAAADRSLTALDVAAGSARTYDPSGVAPDATAAARAVDRTAATSWVVTAAAARAGVGLVVRLPTTHAMRGVRLLSRSGLRADVYAAEGLALPPTVTDVRWTHVRTIRSVPGAARTFRFPALRATSVLLWVTGRGEDRERVGVSTLRLLRRQP